MTTTAAQSQLRWALAALMCVALLVFAAAPASATGGSISCAGSSESINNGNQGNGNSIALTTNHSKKCGGVGHMARTNVNGQLLWSSGPTLVWNQSYNNRTFYGSMHTSRHYHNGTYNSLYY